jgi:hypothetical protein
MTDQTIRPSHLTDDGTPIKWIAVVSGKRFVVAVPSAHHRKTDIDRAVGALREIITDPSEKHLSEFRESASVRHVNYADYYGGDGDAE